MTWDSRDSRDTDRMHAALAKRAGKAAKREEDARRTEDGRRWPGAFPHWTDRPRGMWDRECDYWRRLFEDERTHDPRFVGPGPRWRQRLNHRRSLPWVGRVHLHSPAQFRRLSTPRSFVTRAWRKMRRHEKLVAWRGWDW